MRCEHPSWRIVQLVINSRVIDPHGIKNYMIIACKNCGNYRVLNSSYEELSKML